MPRAKSSKLAFKKRSAKSNVKRKSKTISFAPHQSSAAKRGQKIAKLLVGIGLIEKNLKKR